MSPAWQRLRAELANDVRVFDTHLDELASLPQLTGNAGAVAQAAVALHHAYGAIESALLRVARNFEGDVAGSAGSRRMFTPFSTTTAPRI